MSNYPSNWDSIRRRIYKRDNHTCQECGATDAQLHCHHKTPISQGGGHEDENLITLCKDCHEDVHGYQIGRESKKLTTDEMGTLAAAISVSIVLSIAIPPLALVGIPFAILCFLALLGGLSD